MTSQTRRKPGPKYEGLRITREFEVQSRTPKSLRKRIKGLLAYLPASHTLRLLAYWSDLRVWKKQYLSADTPAYEHRYGMWQDLMAQILPDRIAYLEFGCANGEIVEYWAEHNTHPDSRFWGFDTFTGMPEEWKGLGWKVEEGAWSQGGEPPQPMDPRVGYVKGRFQDSVEGFIEREAPFDLDVDHFVIHIDADLYSATLYVLVMMRPILDRATVLFDEFDCVLDEMRALDDFCRSFGLQYKVLATAASCEKIAIQFIK
ncbi:hypothetical protein [Primorskyibacter sp. S187A]|uniref:hypothetical protein n=1 Tax=Primorskyibacter sp. S187A TaxID=3415130 RepID=UPI003C7E0A70